ncbi:hypothetical protein [Paenibacillus taichungensis]|uniref:hypothetical protein n=1 Tax=Paenibacillus taichungensis TaxID=484184 RepID=UPI0039A24D9E
MTETQTVLLEKLNQITSSDKYKQELLDILESTVNDSDSQTIAHIIKLNLIVFSENIKDLSDSYYQSTL